MEKASAEMDLEDWEILDFHHRGGKETPPNRKSGMDINCLICPSPRGRRRLETPDNSGVPDGMNKLVPVPIQLELMVDKSPDQELAPPAVSEKIKDVDWVGDQDMISQVFFKKMEENKFVDMKMDSPRSGGGRGLQPQIDLGAIQFEEEEDEEDGEACKSEDFDHKEVSEEGTGTEYERGSEVKGNGCWEGGGLNIWRWSVTGIGALCSMGVAAATICVFIFGSHQRQKQLNQNQKLQFQIYEEDKGIKQVVQHATRLNHALSSVRGVPLTRAHITFGGFYNGPQA